MCSIKLQRHCNEEPRLFCFLLHFIRYANTRYIFTFIIWNNELCLDKVTVYSELETTFYFLSCIPSVLSKAWLKQFHDIQIIRHKALVCMWIRVDLFYVWLTLEERTAMIMKCLDNSNMLEEKAIHGSLVIAIVQKKCNFEPDCYFLTIWFD